MSIKPVDIVGVPLGDQLLMLRDFRWTDCADRQHWTAKGCSITKSNSGI